MPDETPVEEWSHWPQGLLDAHKSNLETIRVEAVELEQAKKQRMIDNGVPDEKQSI